MYCRSTSIGIVAWVALTAGQAACPPACGANASATPPVTQPTTQPTTQATDARHSLFRDPEDGAFDVSGFLDTRTGFLPLAIPITEPAVGYGLGAGLTFFHVPPRIVQSPDGPRVIPPTATAVFGMATENGSWAAGSGHMHTWNDGRVRYLVGGGYAELNLDWFGRSDAFEGRAFSYEMDALFFLQKLTFKLADSDFFLGPTQRFASIDSVFDRTDDLPAVGPPLGVEAPELDGMISGLGITLGYDTRNSMFSPTRGTKAGIGVTVNDDAIGSDFDYARIDAEVLQYVPLGGSFTLGLRATTAFVGDDAPFFDLASVSLRGIQAGRYVDNIALTVEAELRWDVTTRWTLVGFGGVGRVAEEFDELDDASDRWAGGTGFRYLIARRYDLRVGCDIARGPEDWAFYVTVGTGWLRD
jgi:hypothetical protein